MEINSTSSGMGITTTSGSNAVNTGVFADSSSSIESPAGVPNGAENTSDFAAFMSKAFGGDGKKEVNEEELFAALIERKLAEENPEAAEAYRTAKIRNSGLMAKSDGYVPWEDVAKKSLQDIVSAGTIDRATADRVNGIAFAAAQLDDNLSALYDGRGSANDPTIATAELESALRSMQSILDKIESGEMTIAPMAITVASNTIQSGGHSVSGSSESSDERSVGEAGSSDSPSGTQRLDGSGGFLWKPVSESTSKLVVLLPRSFVGKVDRVEIHRSLPADEDTKIETGRFSSVANGGRPHFRFDRAGGDYPDGSYVVAYQNNGEVSTWQISDSSARND